MAQEGQPLEAIVVNGYIIQSPYWLSGNAFLPGWPNMPIPNHATFPRANGPVSQHVCSVLEQFKPAGCSMSTYPASPGLPSASGASWAPNDCGSGPFGTALGATALAYLSSWGYLLGHPRFSGDMERPVKDNPSIDFGAYCNDHDHCYAAGVQAKRSCDTAFGTAMHDFCDVSTAPDDCNAYATLYHGTVVAAGQSAYDDAQAAKKCSAWGNAMKANGCEP